MGSDWLGDIFRSPEARGIALVAVLAMLVAVGIYIVGKIRGQLRESDVNPGDFLTNFRELHSRGELSDEEYRTIKAKLAPRLRERLQSPVKDKDHGS
jgi:hypothetical protein